MSFKHMLFVMLVVGPAMVLVGIYVLHVEDPSAWAFAGSAMWVAVTAVNRIRSLQERVEKLERDVTRLAFRDLWPSGPGR